MALRNKKRRNIADRTANFIEYAINTSRQRNWLIEDDLTILEDVFAFVQKRGAGAWYEINSIISIVTSKQLLCATDGARAAEFLALVENFADQFSVHIYDDTRGAVSYKDFSVYHKTRTQEIKN